MSFHRGARASMSVPSMVHRSGDSLIVRSVVSGDALFGSADAAVQDSDEDPPTSSSSEFSSNNNNNDDNNTITTTNSKDLPECKVKRNYSCSSCDFFTQNPRHHLYHLRDVHSEKVKIYECPNCLYASKHFQKLLRHTKMVHGDGNGNSNSGNGNSGNSVDSTNTRHIGNTKKRSLPPPTTTTTTEDDDVVGAVPDDLEDTAGVFKCSVCAFVAKNRALLARHEREEHIKTKFFRCTKCTYVTHMKARFTKHVKYHSMPMIKCDMCDFRTPYKWNLDRHCKNHNGKGAFKCSACNFTADIKQSLTVHEMNHHVPPVGQAAGLGVGRRRNKVGASDATAAEDAAAVVVAATARHQEQVKSGGEDIDDLTTTTTKNSRTEQPPPIKKLKSSTIYHHSPEQGSFGPDFIHPDDIIHHANGNVYIKNKCKLCNFKSAWNSEMAKHEKKVHNIIRESSSSSSSSPKLIKKPTRPIPNLIPIPTQSSGLKLNKKLQQQQKIEPPDEPVMSQQDIKEICAKSANSALKDFASLFGSEDVFKDLSSVENKVPDLLPASFTTTTTITKINDDNNNNNNNLNNNNNSNNGDEFKQKHASFFDRLKEKLMTVESGNLICTICGHESKCLTAHATHEKICGKECNNIQTLHPTFLKSTRCPYCRQRCKTSAILDNHLQTCPEALKATIKTEDIESDNELKIDESQSEDGIDNNNLINQPHPMENRVFVWNNITVPMDIEIDDNKYEYQEDKIDDNISLDLSVRTQSPGGSENSYIGGQDYIINNNNNNNNSIINNNNNNKNNNSNNNNNNNNSSGNTNNSHHHSGPSTDKIPTHGNDISIAQHKRVFKCPHCSFWASTASRFHVHIVGHLNKKPFECSLCAYRSNWRWDITKHIKLKSVRDPAHESAKVLMTDETGRRNYTKYNKYLTEIHVSGDQSMETSGGSGTRHRHHDGRTLRSSSPNNNNNNNNNNSQNKNELPKLQKAPNNSDLNSSLLRSNLRPPPPLKAADGVFFDKKRNGTENKRTLFKCKKCNFRDASREVLLAHVKGHYPQQNIVDSSSSSSTPATTTTTTPTIVNNNNIQDVNVRGVSPDKDEASVCTLAKGNQAPFRCGHCNQVSNWKHVIQRHCRLKHSGDIRVVSNKNGQEKLEVEEQIDEPDHIDVPQDGAYKCNSCPYSSDVQNEFKEHLNGHLPSSDSIMKCHYCNYFVTKRDDLIDHFKLHGVEDPEDFFNKLMDRNNSDNGDIGKRFRCLICPYVTNSKSQYTYHKQFHKPRGGQYTCTQCSYNVSKRHLLHQHLKVHGINIVPLKQNGEIIDLDDISDEIEEIPANNNNNHHQFETQTFSDIPLVWVSKNGKFSKMFKCRYCPHVNLRKVNIQEHEKMHTVREKNPNSSRSNDIEHHCTECNYVCNNAGVLSSHSKVHQGLYGTVHCLVDPIKSDEEQIRELSKYLNPSISQMVETINLDEYENAESSVMMDIDEQIDDNGNCLYFCKECPARFLKENEYSIHSRLHGVRLFYKCDYCSYSARQKPHLLAHSKVHTSEYQDRTRVLQSMHFTNNTPPQTYPINGNNDDLIWVVSDNKSNDLEMDIELMRNNKPIKSCINNVPLSGTELFQQKSEAQQKQQAQLLKQSTTTTTSSSSSSPPSPKYSDPQFGTLMHGNPEFIYPTYLKNGRMKEKRYKCHKCPSAFEKREQYRIHLNLHGSEQRYKCEHCDYSVKYYANYVQHLKKHKMNTDAQAANHRRSSDDGNDGGLNDFDTDMNMLIEKVTNDDNKNGLINKLSTGDQQAYKILQRLVNSTSPIKETNNDDKKLFSCLICPYVNYRRDAVDNHQRRHISLSGIKNNFTCEHCDYSVPQAHFLRDHNKLHFLQTKNHIVDGYMVCDDLKLVSNKNNNNNGSGGGSNNSSDCNNSDSDVIYEEHDEEYLPPLNKDIAERFNNSNNNNNNEGEKQFVNIETGDVGDKIDNTTKSMVVDGDNKVDES